ncbi:MAG: hypothetical protein ACYSYL_10110, partial [Planctomycetota bacterium]
FYTFNNICENIFNFTSCQDHPPLRKAYLINALCKQQLIIKNIPVKNFYKVENSLIPVPEQIR